jgi:hypothetical protein
MLRGRLLLPAPGRHSDRLGSALVDGRDFLRFVLVGTLVCAGCTSDETTVCERLGECKLFPEKYTVDDCKADVGVHVSDDRLERCAECVTEESCEELQDACREFCEPIY